MTEPTASVIIPTYNRRQMLVDLLDSLAQQTYPAGAFEVIIVDDGSTDGTEAVRDRATPYKLRYVRQENQGDAAARNMGVACSCAQFLVFLDDDMIVAPTYLEELIGLLLSSPRRVAAGVEKRTSDGNPILQLSSEILNSKFEILISDPIVGVPFATISSNNMALWRQAYLEIGPMQALGFSGSSMWCDVEFNYRAFCQGFEFVRSARAVCWHRDYVQRSLDNEKARLEEAAFRAVTLFRMHPDLLSHLPMFADKTPIAWDQDPPRLIARKFSRRLASTKPVLWALEQLSGLVGRRRRSFSRIAALCYRWIIGGYIFRGFRHGLKAISRNGGRQHSHLIQES